MILADFQLPRQLRSTVAQAARVACPPDLDRHDLAESIVESVELQLRAFPAGFRVAMVAGMASLEAGAVLRYGVPFSRLDPERAAAWFRAWWTSPFGAFRQLAKALKALISMAFYQTKPIREQLQYHPDRWIAEAARRRLETWGVEIARHEEELLAPNPLLTIRRARHA
jgi:hypothetical protein